MRYWIYAEPAGHSNEPIWTILSDKAVLAYYWDYWCERMTKAGKADLINETDCLMDWVTTNWATEVTPQVLEQFILAPNATNSAT